jgi:hypothetical protein
LPEGLVEIDDGTFQGCHKLTDFTFPASVSVIGTCAFYQCYALTAAAIPAGVIGIEESTFYGCTGLVSVTLPAGCAIIDEEAFRGCVSLRRVVIPEGMSAIGDCAFERCTGLTEIDLPASMKYVGLRAFAGCTWLVVAIFRSPDPYQCILRGRNFCGCPHLREVMMPIAPPFVDEDGEEHEEEYDEGDPFELCPLFAGATGARAGAAAALLEHPYPPAVLAWAARVGRRCVDGGNAAQNVGAGAGAAERNVVRGPRPGVALRPWPRRRRCGGR